ncbi:ABC transporter permease [Deinococcus sonorensis]|uniref:ABC transporter permease n=2 Tax=Deinococcus sonorensis TaxID=309891 RepID=A0AAU7UAH5_9DEIO
MRWPFIWQVALKELTSTIRDRRTLTSTILLPLIMIPLFTILFPLLLGKAFSGQQTERQRVGVVGTLPAALRAQLTEDTRDASGKQTGVGVVLVPVADPVKAVQDGTVEAVVQVRQPLPQAAGQGSGTVQLYAKLGNLKASAGVISKVQAALNEYNARLVGTALRARGLGSDFLTPVRVQTIDASKPQEAASGQLAFIIPMFMLQFILAGGMATAIDSTAGEKERGTLEVLLVSPIRRSEVVVGKLIATTLTALVAASCSLLGLAVAGPLGRVVLAGQDTKEVAGVMGGQLSVSLASGLFLVLMAVSAALLLGALLIAVSIFARSYKEAQTYLTPISLLIVLPAVGLQFADFIGRGLGLYSVPLINSMLVILDIVKGAFNAPGAVLALIINLVFTGLLVLLAIRSFGREQVIFRN